MNLVANAVSGLKANRSLSASCALSAFISNLVRNLDGAGDPLGRQIAVELRCCGSSIGRRVRRLDTPFGITIVPHTLENQTVTAHERDSMQQERVGMDRVMEYLRERIDGC